MLPQGEIGLNAQIALVQSNEGRDLQDQVGVEVVQLDLIVVEEPTKEVTRRRAKSPLVKASEADDVPVGRGSVPSYRRE